MENRKEIVTPELVELCIVDQSFGHRKVNGLPDLITNQFCVTTTDKLDHSLDLKLEAYDGMKKLETKGDNNAWKMDERHLKPHLTSGNR